MQQRQTATIIYYANYDASLCKLLQDFATFFLILVQYLLYCYFTCVYDDNIENESMNEVQYS